MPIDKRARTGGSNQTKLIQVAVYRWTWIATCAALSVSSGTMRQIKKSMKEPC